MRNRMNEARAQHIYGLPAYKSQGIPNEDSTEEKRSWFFRRLVDIGVIEDMANPQPKGWNINPSNITVLIAILVFIGGLYSWTYNEAYKRGQQDSKMEQIQKELEDAKKKADAAEKWQIFNSEKKPEDKNNADKTRK